MFAFENWIGKYYYIGRSKEEKAKTTAGLPDKQGGACKRHASEREKVKSSLSMVGSKLSRATNILSYRDALAFVCLHV